jgi:hypothetical protein
MRRLQCSGWCGRIFVNSEGMTLKEIAMCQSTNKCPLCYDTTPLHTWFVAPRPVPPNPPTIQKELCDVKHRRRLYKKLRARTKSNGMTYDGHENDEQPFYEDEMDIEAAEDGEEDVVDINEVDDL